MAELIKCPNCLQWLNLEMHEALLVDKSTDTAFSYECQKCGALFTEYGEVVWCDR